MTISKLLEKKFKGVFLKLGFDPEFPVALRESNKPEFGDYQVNGIMGIAKKLKVNPRELAEKVVAKIKTDDVIKKLEVAGPGFINITLADKHLGDILNADLLKITEDKQQTIVVDYSAPNLAKEMHVGHLRSTIIGDALVRMYEFLGHKVIRRNHIGDWGTQFGMLIAHMVEEEKDRHDLALELNDLEEFYRSAKKRFDEDENFAAASREYVVKLQSGDEKTLALWKQFVAISLEHCQAIYDRLGVKLKPEDDVGESAYNYLLPKVVEDLVAKGVAVDSDGAKCVFFAPGELSTNEETPFIIQKKDGAYLYTTTDIAAIYDRVENLHADRLVYVVDNRQSFHFKQLFAVAKKAKIAKPDTILEHVDFGTMLGDDGKPFKTRTGGTIKLIALIDEAVNRAKKLIAERNQDWSEGQINELAEILGIAAMKYADLSKNRTGDYLFSFDKMLAFDGNTAPYMLYAYVRIMSIFRKANLEPKDYLNKKIDIEKPEEHSLAIHLAKFPDRLLQAANENYPHYICAYIYDFAAIFMRFYESCPIVKGATQEQQISRLALAALTAEVLKTSLDLLGIKVVTRM